MILGYVRVSSEGQKDGTSPEEQERMIRALAEMKGKRGFDVVIYSETVSGGVPINERPQGRALLETAKEGDTIVATKLDRLFRSAKDALVTAEELKVRKVDLVLIDLGTTPVTENGHARLFFGMLALVAEFEKSLINERTAMGRAAKLARGGHVYGSAVYGYRIEGKGKDSYLVPEPVEQETIRIIREARETRPITGVLEYLDGLRLRNRAGGPFRYNQIQRILGRENARPDCL